VIVTVYDPTGSGFGDTDVIGGPATRKYRYCDPTTDPTEALICTDPLPGIAFGDVYKPVCVIVPTVEFPEPAEPIDQVTAGCGSPSPDTVAWN
jgi:hypothetical protein